MPMKDAFRPQSYFPGWHVVAPAFGYDSGWPEIGVLRPQIKDPSGQIVDIIPTCERCLELLEAFVAAAEREAAAVSAATT
jgi:hypothetical protein